jgi:DNA-binding CsgD family transcriptional regulator
MVLLDAGRFEEAQAQVTTSIGTAASDRLGRIQFVYLAAEADFMVGRVRSCLAQLETLLRGEMEGDEIWAFAKLLQMRASAAQGLSGDDAVSWPDVGFFTAAPVETEATAALVGGHPEDASRYFQRAAELWEPHYVRSALFCGWQSGLAALSAGDVARAVHRLESVEAQAAERAMTWQLARTRQGLRQAGVRRPSGPGTNQGTLTAREAEVVRLAGSGASNAEIAVRLGLARRTVETLLASARAKLGARSKTAAAAGMEPM